MLVLTCHDRLPLSSPVSGRTWPQAIGFSGSAFVAAGDAMRCSGSADIVIAGSATVARVAAPKHVGNNTAAPTAAINGARKGVSTTGTAKESIVAAKRGRA